MSTSSDRRYGPNSGRSYRPQLDESTTSLRPKAPWPLDTHWSAPSIRSNGESSTRDASIPRDSASSRKYDFTDLPLTPPDSTETPFSHASPSCLTESTSRYPSATPRISSLQDDSPQKPSKNDIFNSPTSWITPPGRFQTDGLAQSISPPTKNSLFYSPISAAVPPTLLRSKPSGLDSEVLSSRNSSLAASPVVSTQQSAGRKHGHTRNSSLGRATSEERVLEEARIRNTRDVDFRLCPSQEYVLGEGRHCTVYLGSYWSRKAARQQQPPDQFRDPAFPAWELCAIKRLRADRQSQLLGLDEAFALRRLGSHPNIIQLIDIRDEVEFSPTSQVSNTETNRVSPSAIDSGLRNPEQESSSHPRYVVNVLRHPRSTSDVLGKGGINIASQGATTASRQEQGNDKPLASETETSKLVRHASIALQPDATVKQDLVMPTFHLQAPENGDLLSMTDQLVNTPSVRPTASAPIVRKSSPANADPPRLLILLELLPNNLALYAKKHVERIDFEQWLSWAKQMAQAISFLHSKGCVHADIKKENMLLSENLDIKLCDFNSAVFPVPGDPPRDGLGLGTPAYCAPELSRATGGPGATSFSYPIDVFSLGAVLYSLATNCEPFSNARSIMEMLHRKRAFFESEEHDRTSRIMVEAGNSPNSQPASRRSSLRGRKQPANAAEEGSSQGSTLQTARSLSDLLQRSNSGSNRVKRETSTDSLESVASGITTMTGRSPSSLAISRLLEPMLEPRGLLAAPPSLDRRSSLIRCLNEVEVQRRSSIGRGHKQSPVADRIVTTRSGMKDSPKAATISRGQQVALSFAMQSTKSLEPPHRVEPVRRRSSCGDELDDEVVQANPISTKQDGEALAKSNTIELSTTPTTPSHLQSIFVAPSVEEQGNVAPPSAKSRHVQTLSESNVEHPDKASRSYRRVASGRSTPSTWPQQRNGHSNHYRPDEENAEYLQAYSDGTPAIFLPGGGRLPDEARELLRTMLLPDPEARPTAQQVLQTLETFDRFCT